MNRSAEESRRAALPPAQEPLPMRTFCRLLPALLALLVAALAIGPPPARSARGDSPAREAADPSPIALALSSDGSRLLTANQGTGSVSLIDPKAGKVLAEVVTGEKPAGVALSRDGRRAVVTHWYGYDVAILDLGDESLKVAGRVEVGPEPRGVVISADGRTAYVAVGVSNEVVRIDLDEKKVTGRLEVGREPRGLALSPDGKWLIVGNARGRSLSIIDAPAWTVARTELIDADNLRQLAFGTDGKTVYAANMKNRKFATTQRNIDIGWVLGQRVTRLNVEDTSGDYQTLSLDPEGRAAADVHGVGVSPDGKTLAVSSGGTHELLLFRHDGPPLPWRTNMSRDLIDPGLLKGDGRFRRVALGGRPTELVFSPDGKRIYVANYLGNSVQVVEVESASLEKTISLGGPETPSLARQGEALFHDATRSFNQWYSCNTCHSDGHTNGLDFDTMNDGWQDLSTAHKQSRKKVPTMRGVAKTAPWTWHGWQTSLEDAVAESYTKSMQGKRPSSEEAAAVVEYLKTLDFPRNPYRGADGSISEAAKRGEAIYRSEKAACNTCHGGPELTDGKIHKVGLEESRDVYKGYNPPSLRGVYDKDPYLHDGRAKTLREALTQWHNPETVTGLGGLSDAEMDDLIAYLKTL